MNFDAAALRAKGIDLGDTTSTPYTEFDPITGEIKRSGVMGRGVLLALQDAGGAFLFEQSDPTAQYVNPATKRLNKQTAAMKNARAAAQAAPAAEEPPPLQGVPLADFVMAVYWEKKGDPEPMRKWVAAMDADLKRTGK